METGSVPGNIRPAWVSHNFASSHLQHATVREVENVNKAEFLSHAPIRLKIQKRQKEMRRTLPAMYFCLPRITSYASSLADSDLIKSSNTAWSGLRPIYLYVIIIVRLEQELVAANVRLEDDLSNSLACKGVVVVLLDGSGLLEQRGLLEAGGDEGCTLVGVFGSDVSPNSTALVEDEAIVILC